MRNNGLRLPEVDDQREPIGAQQSGAGYSLLCAVFLDKYNRNT